MQNPWKPNYEALHLNDLLVMNGELTERMTETLQHVITLLKARACLPLRSLLGPRASCGS